MPQQFTLYPDLTADENVDFVASPVRDARAGAAGGASARCSSSSSCGRPAAGGRASCPAACSAGSSSPPPSSTSRRCCSSTSRPPGIDPILRQTIWDELARLKAAGRTLLVTTQYVSEAEACDAVALIAGGRLIALGPPDELRRGAAGGDVIEVETDAPFDPAVLVGKEGDPRGAEHRAPPVPGRDRRRRHDDPGPRRPRRRGRRHARRPPARSGSRSTRCSPSSSSATRASAARPSRATPRAATEDDAA